MANFRQVFPPRQGLGETTQASTCRWVDPDCGNLRAELGRSLTPAEPKSVGFCGNREKTCHPASRTSVVRAMFRRSQRVLSLRRLSGAHSDRKTDSAFASL